MSSQDDSDLIGRKVVATTSSDSGLRVTLDNGTTLSADVWAGEGTGRRYDGTDLIWEKDS